MLERTPAISLSAARATALAAFAAAALAAAPAGAQFATEDDERELRGTLSAFACAQMPAAARVSVEAQEDTEGFRHLKARFVEILRQRNIAIDQAAPLRASLYVEARRENAARPSPREPFPVPELAEPGREAFVDVWSNTRTSLLGGKRSQSLSVDEVHVTILITDSRNGRCVWQGEAIHPIGERDELAVADGLIDGLTRHIGRTSNATSITLQ